jgi:hypothetical protein
VDSPDASLWASALTDAELTERDARLFFFDNRPTDSPVSGDSFAPGQLPARMPRISDRDRDSANAARDTFRITVDRHARDNVLVWALVRHELEHCRQYQHYGHALAELGRAIDETIVRVYGPIPGVYTLYNLMPSEATPTPPQRHSREVSSAPTHAIAC